jgi:hypothetical protein
LLLKPKTVWGKNVEHRHAPNPDTNAAIRCPVGEAAILIATVHHVIISYGESMAILGNTSLPKLSKTEFYIEPITRGRKQHIGKAKRAGPCAPASQSAGVRLHYRGEYTLDSNRELAGLSNDRTNVCRSLY